MTPPPPAVSSGRAVLYGLAGGVVGIFVLFLAVAPVMGIYPADHSYIVRELTPEQRALGARLLADRGLSHDVIIDRDDALAMIAEAMVVPGRIALAASTGRRHCRVCGCGDITACRTEEDGVEVPCSWAEPGICTACAPFVERPS